MGIKRTCKAYQRVNTKRGVFELRCSKWGKHKGKAICDSRLKGARSRGLIHPEGCKEGWHAKLPGKKRRGKSAR